MTTKIMILAIVASLFTMPKGVLTIKTTMIAGHDSNRGHQYNNHQHQPRRPPPSTTTQRPTLFSPPKVPKFPSFNFGGGHFNTNSGPGTKLRQNTANTLT